MMVGGKVINKTTEVTPRPVANGMLLFSTAPDEDADVIASLEFDEPKISSPIYYTISPKVLGYNKYGELIADGVEGVTYTCSDAIGAPNADGSAIEVGGTPAYGTITAHLGDIEVTSPISVVNSEFAIRIKPMILLDNYREYPIEISTIVNGNELKYDSGRFEWTVEDPSVAEINDGVIHGLKEGITKISASLGDFTDETTVKVEIASAHELLQPWTDWTVTSTNLSQDAVLGSDGTISYGFEGKRRADITLAKDVTFYSLPDKVMLDFNTSTPLSYMQFDLRHANVTEENVIKINTEAIPAGSYSIDLLDYVADRTDLLNFPLTVKSISYGPHAYGYVAGSNTITQSLYAVYEHYSSGVEGVCTANRRIGIYGANDGAVVVSAAGIDLVDVTVCNIAGTEVAARRIGIGGGVATVSTGLKPGVYIVKAVGGGETATAKLIIR